MIFDTLPDSVEKVKLGNMVYTMKGNDVSWILVYGSHVDIGFFRGAELNSKLLEGTGKGLRHVKIINIETMPIIEIMKLLKQAAELKNAN